MSILPDPLYVPCKRKELVRCLTTCMKSTLFLFNPWFDYEPNAPFQLCFATAELFDCPSVFHQEN